jgi:cellulose synthase/poly-beta-1,6-N-acetylglucosamine synthase-like glycosyltransferase
MQYPFVSPRPQRAALSRREVRRKHHVVENYQQSSSIAGPLVTPASSNAQVAFRHVVVGRNRWILSGLILLNIVSALAFLSWLLAPGHLPLDGNRYGTVGTILGLAGFIFIVVLEIVRLSQAGVLALFASRMRDPVPMVPEPGLRVAVLTTIVPSKEPVDLVARTLRAMRALNYDGQVDVWILDEGNDPQVRAVAEGLGVHHFSRNGRPEYNQPSGEFRARSKAGNHNAWRAEHEHEYDIVAQMDPDHVPTPDFLERTLGYFRDRDVAFVVAPQVYGNLEESFVARGAADQSYLFHGVIQRGGNGLNAPLLIGTNHLYRTTALHQIGGYQDSVIEDHLTSLTLHATVNPATGSRWKGIYTPDILAIGEGPAGWTDYFNQQQRWAYGIWSIAKTHSRRMLRQLTWPQRLAYVGLQSYYPSVAIVWTLGNLLTMLYLVLGVTSISLDRTEWLLFWTPTILAQFCLFLWLRRFNLAAHEQRVAGAASGLLLSLAAGPIYVAAGASSLIGKPLTYVVTAKSSLASSDSLQTFRLHTMWIGATLAGLVTSAVAGHHYVSLWAWAIFTLLAAAFPIGHFALRNRQRLATQLPQIHPARLASFSAVLMLPLVVLISVGISVAHTRTTRLELTSEMVRREGIVVSDPAPTTSSGVQPQSPAAAEPTAAPLPMVALPGDTKGSVMYGIFSESGISPTGNINHVYYQWTEPAGSFAGFIDYSAGAGRVAMISWEPRLGPIRPEPVPTDTVLLTEIAGGSHDAYIRSVAKAVNGTGQPVIFRFAFEMDLESTGLHPWAGQDPTLYRQAYRHVVDLFEEQGASTVRWLWSPSAMTDDDGNLIAAPYYPGSDYVDYVGFSAFLYWQWEEWSPERKLTHAYRSPDEYFRRPVEQLGELGKPIIIPEFGADLHPSAGLKQREAWITRAARQMVGGAYPGVVAVVYFNTEHNWDDADADWRLTTQEMERFIRVFQEQTMSRPFPLLE